MVYAQNYAKKLVNADRTSLFLLDGRTKELYARVFDMGDETEHSKPFQKEIRSGILSKKKSHLHNREVFLLFVACNFLGETINMCNSCLNVYLVLVEYVDF